MNEMVFGLTITHDQFTWTSFTQMSYSFTQAMEKIEWFGKYNSLAFCTSTLLNDNILGKIGNKIVYWRTIEIKNDLNQGP